MELISNNDGKWSLKRVSELEYLMLSRIQDSADPSGCEEAVIRLYPSPVTPTAKLDPQAVKSIEDDWREYAGPDIRDGFGKALNTVGSDLASACVEEADGVDYYGLTVPDSHAESWCSALNQARLVLHHKHDLPSEAGEMESGPVSEEWLAILQSEIYGMIMEFLIKEVLWE
jgi:hypothetical protein